MNVVEYVLTGIGIVMLFLIYGYIYIMIIGKKEKCVICGKPTAYAKDTPIIQRAGYIEGAGQLCNVCDGNIYPSLRTAAQNKK